MPIIIPGNRLASTGHTISQSIRFNDDDSAYMSRTFSASNRKTFTVSLWAKRGNLSSNMNMFGPQTNNTGSGTYGAIRFNPQNTLDFFDYTNGTHNWYYSSSTRVFRDPSAWYHIVASLDTTNATSSERIKVYINGQREVGWSGNSGYYPTLDYQGQWNNNLSHEIGAIQRGSTNQYFDGYLAEIVFIDGQALSCDSFGEFNSSGIWVPKDISGLTFGTNGCHIDGRDASDLGDDESGNGNDFTTSGLAAHDQVLDSPTNNFSTMNPLANPGSATVAEGNLKATMASGTKKGIYNNIAISSGKWYVEGRLTSSNNGSQYAYTGIEDYNSAINSGQYIGRDTYGYSYDPANGGVLHNNSYVVSSGTLPSLAQNDIVQIAVDLDNNYIYWGKNGTFLNSGDPTSGSSGTGGVSVIDPASQPSGHYHIGHGNGTGSSGYQSEIVWNFGQDSTFAGATTAGGNSDGNGIGNFKYSVPSGFLALCTKNLGS